MQQTATDLGVVGWVRNLPAGSVAFHAEGTEAAVESLLSWSKTGPTFARVDGVDVERCEVAHLDSFAVLP